LVTEVLRAAQAVELRRVVDSHLAADPNSRLAVLGDFNDTLESEGLRILRGDARGARAPHLARAELVPAALAVPEDQRFSQIYRGRRELLDHILLSPGLFPHLEGTRILNEDLAEAENDAFPDPWREGSDHAPVLAVLKV
jgi:endonuclease/exonuclease/phosphatase family metal-dependent hydrolase